MPWKTFDPFLFCVHHNDAYPKGNEALGPAPDTRIGRNIGADFSGKDGWNMYHGDTVPGFPQHPHRGFETVTFVRRGFVDHSDSLRATARYGAGDTQWLTAGAGIVHAEMFPLLHSEVANPMELFQIWLNLPRVDKMTDPNFAMLWAEDIPVIEFADNDGQITTVTIVAGPLHENIPPSPPPGSWAARPDTDVAIWRIAMTPGARWSLPPAADGTLRTLYNFEGGSVSVGNDAQLDHGMGAMVACTEPIELVASSQGATLLMLQGRPINEPVAQYGPFVMNDRAGIEQAYADYQRTQFGGWPWADDAPNHGATLGRFVRRPDRALELPPGSAAEAIG